MSRDSFYIKRMGKQISDIRMIMYLFYLACFPLTVFPSTSIIYLTSGLSRNAPDGKRRIVKDREQQLLSAQGSHATCRPGAKALEERVGDFGSWGNNGNPFASFPDFPVPQADLRAAFIRWTSANKDASRKSFATSLPIPEQPLSSTFIRLIEISFRSCQEIKVHFIAYYFFHFFFKNIARIKLYN